MWCLLALMGLGLRALASRERVSHARGTASPLKASTPAVVAGTLADAGGRGAWRQDNHG